MRERRSMDMSAHKDFKAIGTFVSAAPRIRLLGALKQLKPQLDLRLRVVEADADMPRYEVEVEIRDLQREQQIDLWLGIKGALTSAFPPHRPGAVRSLQP
jgi:hypothetical protein